MDQEEEKRDYNFHDTNTGQSAMKSEINDSDDTSDNCLTSYYDIPLIY